MSGNKVTSAVNQQETLFYFTGFLSGEGSFSLIKATNKKGGTGFYFTPDITISNSDLNLLKEANKVMVSGMGVISPIKGGYNLSIRGKEKVKIVLDFLENYPPICGDLILEKILILRRAIKILSKKKGRNKRLPNEEVKIEKLRERLREIKTTAISRKGFRKIKATQKETGYFLAGLVDAEGSMGFRRCNTRLQPYFCVLMREKKLIELIQRFFGFGNIYYRPAEKLFHFETAKKGNVLQISRIFLNQFPLKLLKNRERLEKIQWILNDYTPNLKVCTQT